MKQNVKNIPVLPVYQYQMLFSTTEQARLSAFPGSAWRGAFGHALKKAVCVVRDQPCASCMLKTSCAYSYIFETPPPESSAKMRKYNASPHPFVLQFPLHQPAENRYSLNIMVYGHGQRYFPYIVHAMQKAGQEGIGSRRQVFELNKITLLSDSDDALIIYKNGKLETQQHAQAISIPAMPKQIKIVIHTPIRIKQDGHNLNPQYFNFGAFFGNILRRISMLTYFHTDTPLEIDFAELMSRAKQINFSNKDLYWYDLKRYSSRQKTEMNMGGVLGSLEIDSQGLDDFWPYLWLGQWTHAGKATSMGLGHYSIDMASLS